MTGCMHVHGSEPYMDVWPSTMGLSSNAKCSKQNRTRVRPAAAAVFAIAAVRAPVAMKHSVFTIDLISYRTSPQIPCMYIMVLPCSIQHPKPDWLT